MRKYYSISGYWKDSKESFENLVVTNYNDVEIGGIFKEEDIFYFGLNSDDIEYAIKDGEDTIEDFVITKYITL